jgi:hypothetical protein
LSRQVLFLSALNIQNFKNSLKIKKLKSFSIRLNDKKKKIKVNYYYFTIVITFLALLNVLKMKKKIQKGQNYLHPTKLINLNLYFLRIKSHIKDSYLKKIP